MTRLFLKSHECLFPTLTTFSASLPVATSLQELYNTPGNLSGLLAVEMSKLRRSSAFTTSENPCAIVIATQLIACKPPAFEPCFSEGRRLCTSRLSVKDETEWRHVSPYCCNGPFRGKTMSLSVS